MMNVVNLFKLSRAFLVWGVEFININDGALHVRFRDFNDETAFVGAICSFPVKWIADNKEVIVNGILIIIDK